MIEIRIGRKDRPTETEGETWERYRYGLVLDPSRAMVHRAAQVVSSIGIVLAVAEIHGMSRFTEDIGFVRGRPKVYRYNLLGTVIRRHPAVGKPSIYEDNSVARFVYGPLELDDVLIPREGSR